jgi:repressor of nif and glnA expression
MVAILRVLRSSGIPLGAERISEELHSSGTFLSERAVRNYLAQADDEGWTRNLGRRGRLLTAAGKQEADSALVFDKVGFVAARVDALAYQMTFNPDTCVGSVILNMSTVAREDMRAAMREVKQVYDARLGMGRRLIVGKPGDPVGDTFAPPEKCIIGTVCSVSINGILQRARVATRSRFGGLLQIEDGQPKRFTQIINYDGTSLDPLEIFIRGHMTSVGEAARTGSGIIGASFREVPTIALPEVRKLLSQSERIGLGGVIAIGQPNQPLLDIPVAHGCVGIIVAGGLNPIAAVVEAGISTTSAAMHSLCDYDRLLEYNTIVDSRERRTRPILTT